MMLTSSVRPNRSGWPRRSIRLGRPAAPIAMPHGAAAPGTAETVADDHPEGDAVIAAAASRAAPRPRRRDLAAAAARDARRRPARRSIDPPRRSPSRSPAGAARSSGSAASARREWTPTGSPRPAAGPCRLRPPAFPASADGVTVARSTMRPSAFETIFCATTTTSPAAQLRVAQRGDDQRGEVVALMHHRHARHARSSSVELTASLSSPRKRGSSGLPRFLS